MNFLRIFILIALLFSCPSSFAKKVDDDEHRVQHRINFLPDGTEIKFENKRVYYVCGNKWKPMPKGKYMLADGTVIKVKKGKLISDPQRYQRPTAKKSKKRAKKAAKAGAKKKLVPHEKN